MVMAPPSTIISMCANREDTYIYFFLFENSRIGRMCVDIYACRNASCRRYVNKIKLFVDSLEEAFEEPMKKISELPFNDARESLRHTAVFHQNKLVFHPTIFQKLK